VLAGAVSLDAAPGGLGTHTDLGLPECSWITMMDMPCPSCGMTTAFTHATDGHLLAAADAQPLGFVLALVAAATVILGTHGAVTGAPLLLVIQRSIPRSFPFWLIGAGMLAWGWKLLSHFGHL